MPESIDQMSAVPAAFLRIARAPADLDPAQTHQRGEIPSRRLDAMAIVELLEELDTGIIVCTEEGYVELANNVARCELREGRPLAIDPTGALCLTEGAKASLLHWRAALRAAVQSRRRQLLALRDEQRTLMVSVMPLGQDPSRVLVMLGRRQPAPDLAVEMLGKLCELTGAEQYVLGKLLAGQRVEEIARTRSVKLSTLRTQVSSLRDKLGARRLEDLVRMAAELPPMTTILRSPALRTIEAFAGGPSLNVRAMVA
jgi:DNA-binding CsgD family transcriptional regulator